MKVMKVCGERPVLTFQFDVSTLQKQLRSVIQIHLDHSANLGSFLLNVCVDDAKSLLSAVSDASTRVNLSSYIVNGFCRKYAN